LADEGGAPVAKRKLEGGCATTERRLNEGRGNGHGKDYKPWLRVQDVPSQGLANRVPGSTTGREHHLFSNLEYDCFLVLDWEESVIDIREQYPLLPLEETLALAEEIGIRHPTYPGSEDPVVCTTDFLISIQRGRRIVDEAIAAKPFQKLAGVRVLEKLELERRYWEKRNSPLHIITEREIPMTLVENLKWLQPYQNLQALSPLTADDVTQIRACLERYLSGLETLSKVAQRTDDRLGLTPGTSLSVARYLLASRLWRADLSEPLGANQPLRLLDKPYSSGVSAS
jgi:hypothetical protein